MLMNAKYDVMVVGGGTAGCAAAYTAGKLGFKTLLVEKNLHLGGTITSGLVIPVMKSGENQINTDFYNDLTAELKTLGGQVTYQDNQGWFNPELCKIALDNLMKKANVDVLFNTFIKSVNLNCRLIRSVELSSDTLSVYNYPLQASDKLLSVPIETRYVIDATGNCEVAKLCGCEFLGNNEEIQPASMRFIMGGVDTKRFANWISDFDKDRNVTTVEVIDDVTHFSTAYTWDGHWALKPLFDDAVDKGVLKDSDRNYFQIFTVAGMPSCVTFNCPRIIEPINNEINLSNALIEARMSIFRLANFCRNYLKGFENCYVSNIADMLGVRVSRRLKGKYIYTIDDLRSGKHFANPVLRSNYPVDVHSAKKNSSTLEVVQDYELPVESLMSADVDNLFTAGRCISADLQAQGALRVQASCFSMGEGLVKYLKKRGI